MIRDWNREYLTGKVFHFQNSLRPFTEVHNSTDERYFLDLDKGELYTFEELDYDGLFFYDDDEDDDFMGVKVDGHVEWVK